MSASPRIGVVLPTRGVLLGAGEPAPASRILRLAETAEKAGVDSLWVGDSLTAKPRLEPLTTLAAVASVTERPRLGTAVLLAALRHPLLLAQTSATVDLLSEGRLTLGMGVGGAFTPAQQLEWKHAGVDQAGRASRLEEVVSIVRRLWSGERVTVEGKHFQLEEAELGFRPYQRPTIPVLLACHAGPKRARQYRRAAELADGMISITDSPGEFASVRQRVLEEVTGRGRDASVFQAVYYMTVNVNKDAADARAEADRWIRAYYGLNFWGDRWGPFGPPEAVALRAREYADAGATEVILRFASFDQEAQLRLLASEVLPALRA
ncbi:MAG: LLM class flavin-dependent oxidoreductase [Chloroflexi bacterium]|nr:LLM class flavin-dependent oxidoreductase [Chloroflexota bacterium]